VSDAKRRAVLIIGVLVILVGVGVAAGGGGASPSSGPLAAGAVATALGTGVTPAGAESSAWFCAGGTGTGGDAANEMIVTNPTPRPVKATVTTVTTGSTGTPVADVSVVPAEGQVELAPVEGGLGGPGASIVVLDGSGVGVTQEVSGPLGFSTAPCASTTSGTWYFADGSTAGGDRLALTLFNPTETVAVVDLSFVSSNGTLAPPAYQGIDVPGGSLVVENLGDHVQDDRDIATEVTSLSGAVVAAELESAGPAGSGGPSVVLGTTTPSTTWSFAQNTAVAQGKTVFHVFNPSSRPARVEVEIGLQQGAAEPLSLRVAPGSVSTLDAQRVTRLPSGTPFAVTFVSGGGVGIVVDRQVSAPATPAVSPPAPAEGDVAGVPGGGDRWLLPAVTSPATGVSALGVVDLGTSPVTVRLSMLTPHGLVGVPGLERQRLRPGSPLVVAPSSSEPIGTVPMELWASGPVAVELDGLPVGSPGVVVVPALPLR
jgi:hypothetical protein